MKMRIVMAVLMALSLLALYVAPTEARGRPLRVEIVAATYIPEDPNEPILGTFIANGPAVDAGVLCPTGTTVDLSALGSGGQSNRRLNLLVHKEFTCDDGSGTFQVKLEVKLDERGFANWNVLRGTGDYVHLAGTGKLVGIPFEGGITDYYTGKMH
ncbi:MAG: hypothetical protein A2W35_22150 [Chloroflexi bacterium RBG_16_57_11]|nr:MAG: hypothetical protein A2W35_22150 [Chloroflexi bacterium RBG_16_57_11]